MTDAAVDALLEARRHLDRFDPTRGVSFLQYVVLAARRNLLNRLAAERRRRAREDRYARGAAAAVGPADDDEPGEDAAALVASLRDTGVVRTDADAAVLRLWLDGERRTAVVATAYGLDDASADAQRAAVKRVRDRIFQRPRPVPPAASRKKDHG